MCVRVRIGNGLRCNIFNNETNVCTHQAEYMHVYICRIMYKYNFYLSSKFFTV